MDKRAIMEATGRISDGPTSHWTLATDSVLFKARIRTCLAMQLFWLDEKKEAGKYGSTTTTQAFI